MAGSTAHACALTPATPLHSLLPAGWQCADGEPLPPAPPSAGVCTQQELDDSWAHISEYDFPEQLADFKAAAQRAGLCSVECLHVDPHHFYRLVVLRK